MKKLIYGINLTIDGCCDHTKGSGDEEIHDYFGNLMKESDVLVYGRKTYQLMVPFWPDIAKDLSGATKSINEFAQAFDSVERIVVFSRTLDKVENGKVNVVSADLKEEIIKLKQGEGKNILLGGVDLPSQMLALDLIDEYHFVIQPSIVGEGRRLFDNVTLLEKLPLKLIETKLFKSGAVALHYVRDDRHK
ncbi:dihydrofolate reductase [Chitinophaga dinghuensis]|uniref:Dihydrofolate reductase n=1 Tax=Chitinophaga dinghuensis TaxID=1539050 RepID=A0A327VGS2_9BACT|nr:dihydrofolate reductase family protein [Chitinophaga dinghuensis]RAJ72784.1 dihydrofolate reductase [Chitinophaga dinghuensis]